MGYIGQMPQAPAALPGRETGSGDKPEHTGARADALPDLLPAGSRSVTISAPPSQPPVRESDGEGDLSGAGASGP